MSEAEDFLVEIGTEELPPKALRSLMEAFGEKVASGLEDVRLQHTDVQTFASPRRLAVLVTDLAGRQQDRAVEQKGPPVKIAFDSDGKPTPAAEAFARKCGVAVAKLQRDKTVKGEWLLTMAYDSRKKEEPHGESLNQLIDPDRYYELYGSKAVQNYEAASASKLYVKVERSRFYALFGDYDSALEETDLSRYDRGFTGFKTEYDGDRFGFSAFATETDQGFIRDEIRGDGTTGLGGDATTTDFVSYYCLASDSHLWTESNTNTVNFIHLPTC